MIKNWDQCELLVTFDVPQEERLIEIPCGLHTETRDQSHRTEG